MPVAAWTSRPCGFRRRLALAGAFSLALALSSGAARAQNPIATENALSGNPASEWDVSGAGDPDIQGFAMQMSVLPGQTEAFKVNSAGAGAFSVRIYRIGWYGGAGARLVATLPSGGNTGADQPAPYTDPATGIADCATWSVSAQWTVPADAVSGVYVAKLVRDDNGHASHVLFVVRDDTRNAAILFKTSDATWQAYNRCSGPGLSDGNSLYTGPAAAGRAYAVSYNRPVTTRGTTPEDAFFNAEYPMVRWLERNGFDVSYCADPDVDGSPSIVQGHRVFMSVGHDEYWSGPERANVEAARDAGVNLAFMSGDECFWKTRYAASAVDAAASRTLVCYKETHANAKIDPLPNVWTGTWRDDRAFNPEGPHPENALSGNIFMVNCCSYAITVGAAEGQLRFWRNTSMSALSGETVATLPAGTLGYEWDEDLDNGFRPAGLIDLSTTTQAVPQLLLDEGSTYGPGTATHHLVMQRRSNGALVFGAGTIQWSWGLDDTHDNGPSVTSQDMQQATVNLLADMGVQPATLQLALVEAAASTDATPPVAQIDAGFPGTATVGVSAAVTGTASDVGGQVGGVEVSVDGGASWHPASGRSIWNYTWTPAATATTTVLARATDDSGNLQTNPASRALVVSAAPVNCPCTVFLPTEAPATAYANDGSAIEVGMKFRAHVAGSATGVRFYKGGANTGTHLGHLWDGSGNLLAEIAFTGESAAGWQEADFGSPVTLTPEQTYVVSVHSDGGYAYTGAYFASALDRAPLRALANGEDGPNGVYKYTSVPAFPTDTYNASNYWVDVVFAGSSGPDVTPPTLVAKLPYAGGLDIAVGSAVTATFSEAMDATSLGAGAVTLAGPNGPVAGTVSYLAATHQAVFTPAAPLAYTTAYTATVAAGAKDLAGNAMAASATWSFTTTDAPPPPAGDGPGGPILVASSPANPFTRYYAEILRAEGLAEFRVADFSTQTADSLARYDSIVLGEQSLSPAQGQMLTDWVNAGGSLLAMRPDKQLAGLLGLADAAATAANGYLQVGGAGPGHGITGISMQYHGTADLYTLAGAQSIATLYSNATTATPYPAVTRRAVGPNGGSATAFAFDLARSVVYTRQGNPAWSGQERDGTPPIRSNDLFYGASATDPQPDWVDLTRVAVPQADEQQRLFANLLLDGGAHRRPLPRFWYFPRGKKAVVVMTGDNHGSYGMQPRFDRYLQQSPAGCSEPDWECVRATGYLYVGTPYTDAQAAFYQQQGFETALHVNTNCADWDAASLAQFYDSQLSAFAAAYPGAGAPTTNRTHCVAWSDWSTQAETETARGIRLDDTYYFWPAAWVGDRPGVFTGSGMPMRFAKLDGTLVDCYQLATQMTDESGQTYPMTADSLLERALDARGYYGAFCANMHFDTSPHPGSDAIVASALARQVPVVSARQMLQWLDARNASAFGGVTWTGSSLAFTVAAAAAARNLEGMVPASVAGRPLASLTRDGLPVATTVDTIKGVAYAFFPATSGAYSAAYPADVTPPGISAVTAAPHTDGTASITWTTDEAADSRVDWGTSPAALGSNASAAPLVTSHAVTLTSLAPGTTYFYRVRSADASANASTFPVAPAVDTLVTPAPPCFVDRTAADFGQGTLSGTIVTQVADGEVALAPAAAWEFSGGTLPGDWADGGAWTTGGSAQVTGGQLVVDGDRALSGAAYGQGSSVEFVATFTLTPFAHVGFVSDAGFDPPWIVFSTKDGSGGLWARVHDGSNPTDVPLAGITLGVPHRFRIDWSATAATFTVDGTVVSTIPAVITAPLHVVASDYIFDGTTLAVDWARVLPYAAGGQYLSRVYDGGGPTGWASAAWSAATPAGTSLALRVRAGDTPEPDGTWAAFVSVPSPGGTIGLSGRYAQYEADLATPNPLATPELQDVQITCTPCTGSIAGVTTLAATPQAAGNGSGGLRRVQLTWSGAPQGASVQVYRKGFGDYPRYRAGVGGEPAVPASPAAAGAAGWTLTGVTAPGGFDAPPSRDFLYYVLFCTGACGVVSAPSNLTQGCLDYVLGDVSDGTTLCDGDNLVNLADLSALGYSYGAHVADGDPGACLDVGPTTDGWVASRPVPDGILDFEDLLLYALDWGVPAAGPARATRARAAAHAATATDAIGVDDPLPPPPGATYTVAVRLEGGGDLAGVSVQLRWNPDVVEPVGFQPGELLGRQQGTGYALSPRPGGVDAVVAGGATGLSGIGELAEITFRVKAPGSPGIDLQTVDARDRANHKVAVERRAAVLLQPVHDTRLGPAFPNPFHGSITMAVELDRAQNVRLGVFDVSGRRVRTLADGPMPAGMNPVAWDGRDDAGNTLRPGCYLVRLEAGSRRFTRMVWRLQ